MQPLFCIRGGDAFRKGLQKGKAMKFIHLADAHLGAEPESGTPLGPIRKREIWDAFRDVIALCEREEVDLLLLPGDLFHGQPLLRDVKEVDYLFGSLTKTRVVLIAGNHDCLLPASHYYDVPFSDNVTFLMDTEADSVYFADLNTEVFGLSYEQKQIAEARYDKLAVTDKSRINILIAHGNINGGDKSIPIHRAAIEAAGFDYAALGHIHTRFDISNRIVYSGGFEPFERKESGPKGYIAGEITKTGEHSEVRWEFVPHAKREYVPMQLEVTAQTTELSLCDELWEKMTERGTEHMYLVTLTGKRAPELTFDADVIMGRMQNRGGYLIELTDETVPDFPVEELLKKHRDDFIGKYIKRLMEEEDKEIAKKAVEYGLLALLTEK